MLPEVKEQLKLLGLPQENGALDRVQLRTAFLKAAMQWHPDKHVETEAKSMAEKRFKLVKEAYESLVARC
jgi:DnaJ-class molecular chaperone